jgi:hypothetical protein
MTAAQGAKYGSIVQGLEAEGVPGPSAIRIALQLLKQRGQVDRKTMIEEIPALYRSAAERVLKVADPETFGLTLGQNEELKQSLQDPRLYNRVSTSDINLGPTRRDIASTFRKASEESIDQAVAAAPEGSEIQRLGEAFRPVKERYGNLATARDAAERGTQRAAQRSNFGMKEIAAGAAEAAQGNYVKAARNIGLMKLLTSRLPSTGASTAYQGYQLGNALRAPAAGLQQSIQPSLAELSQLLTPEQLRAQAIRRTGDFEL